MKTLIVEDDFTSRLLLQKLLRPTENVTLPPMAARPSLPFASHGGTRSTWPTLRLRLAGGGDWADGQGRANSAVDRAKYRLTDIMYSTS